MAKKAAKSGVKVKILGAKESAQNIRNMSRAVRRKFFEELVELATEVLKRAQYYVPFDKGDLHDSAWQTFHHGYYPSTNIGFGGAGVPYAAVQHENLVYKHDPPTRAKYLEVAVQEFQPVISHRLAVASRQETRLYDMHGKRIARK